MEITESEIQSLTIQSMYEIPLETLVTNQALGGGKLMWLGDGILISWGGYNSTDKLIHDQVDGIFYWAMLEYTFELKEYKHSLKTDKLNQEVAIFDMSKSPFYQEVAKYIKSKQDK